MVLLFQALCPTQSYYILLLVKMLYLELSVEF
jgi:hypothetical protein